jgi:uncharacterized membrane protein (UPF0127 family)
MVAVPPGAPECVTPDGTHVHLELALTDEEKQLGLMFRDTLPSDHGMLFIFDADGPLEFWMKNTFIPLDFVWVSAAGEVVDVRAFVRPCRSDPCPSYGSGKPARAVLEVNAGFAAAHGVRPGEQLQFQNVTGFPVSGGKR